MKFATAFFMLTLLVRIPFATTVIVPDSTRTIQTAIDKAGEGDTVFVRNGIYHESLTLKENIALIGESMTKTVISGSKKHPVITAANSALIKTCTIRHGKIGIRAENALCTIDQVFVRDNAETGIHCLVALPNIYNSIVYRNKWSGILCESTRGIKTSIIHNIIADNGYNGISLMGLSEVLIMNNVIIDNRQFGVWGVEESRKSRITYNDFFNNRAAVNGYLTCNATNISTYPGYTYANGSYDFFSPSGIELKGKGKDGATIGLIGSEELTKKLTDPDDDGVFGDADKCPSIPEDIDGFQDDDGCPDFDNDNDGIFDAQDACPNQPEDHDGFKDDDGCPDYDNDNDGIPDSVDVCKNTPETMNGYKDEDGCPDEVPQQSHQIPKTAPPPVQPSITPASPASGDSTKPAAQ